MGSRKRRVNKIVKKRLPEIFDCPVCGENSIKIILKKRTEKALVRCGSCGLENIFEINKNTEPIDIYCMFSDKFYKQIESS